MSAREWWTTVDDARRAGDYDRAMRVLRGVRDGLDGDDRKSLSRAIKALDAMARLHNMGCPVPADEGRGVLVRLDRLGGAGDHV